MLEKIKSFTQLSAWKEGHKLVLAVYNILKKFPVAFGVAVYELPINKFFAIPTLPDIIAEPVVEEVDTDVSATVSTELTKTVPPNLLFPLTTFKEYAVVIVSFVPAIGGPAILRVDAVLVVTAVLVAANVG